MLEGDAPTRPNHALLYKDNNMSTLSTPSGGDFNWSFDGYYWNPERDTAEQYRTTLPF